MKAITVFIFIMVSMNTYAQTAEGTNQHFSHTITSTAPATKIWEIWTDVSNWKEWDTGLKDAAMEGQFELDATGIITSLEGRKSKFRIVTYEKDRSYTMRTKLPLGSLYVKRYLIVEGGKTTFTHEVWFTGLTRGLFAKAFGKKFRAMLPEVIESIKSIALR